MMRILISIAAIFFTWPLFAEEKEGGIIGTGVIGQITGLKRFEVSGMQFDFAADIELKGVRALEDLRLGMTLVLSTGREGDAWQVETLQHMPPLTGPVTGPNEVMGVPVIGALPNSDKVQVDGFWSEAGIVVSRAVEFMQDFSRVTGYYDGGTKVGLVPVAGADLSAFEVGDTLSITGKWVDGALIAEAVTRGPFMSDPPNLVLLEGIFQPIPKNEMVSLHGVAVANANSELDANDSTLVRRCALNGRTDFDRSELSPHDKEMVNSFCISASN